MTSLHPYHRQARTYDETRGVSPSVLTPLLAALARAPGPELLDIGGGTGNYAVALRERGWRPTVLDVEPAMLARAAEKGLPVLEADAAALPLGDQSADAEMLVSMIHHVRDWRGALREARRVVRPGGRVAVMGWAREHVDEITWLVDYFPSSRRWMEEIHPPLADLVAELPGARVLPVVFDDAEDGSVGALQRSPELVLDPEVRRQTSYFERLADHHPGELADGLAALRADLAAGRRPDEERAEARARLGDAYVLAWARSR